LIQDQAVVCIDNTRNLYENVQEVILAGLNRQLDFHASTGVIGVFFGYKEADSSRR